MAMQKSNALFNTQHLLPATGYYNKLMREVDEAFWIGENDTAELLEREAKHIKESYVDKGEVWYPTF